MNMGTMNFGYEQATAFGIFGHYYSALAFPRRLSFLTTLLESVFAFLATLLDDSLPVDGMVVV